jgi:teichuronic acid exporter
MLESSPLRWAAIERTASLTLTVLVQLTLVRLLIPEDFGVFAIASVLMQVLASVIDGGVGLAVVQRKDLSEEDLSTAYYLNLAFAGTAALAVWLAAPWIAQAFDAVKLSEILKILCLALPVGALSVVRASLLVRQMRFKQSALVTIPSHAVAGTIAIAAALHGFGAYALVAHFVSLQLLRTFFYRLVSNWAPTASFSMDSLRSIRGFSVSVASAAILDQLTNAAYTLTIGLLFPARELGYFNRAMLAYQIHTGNVQQVVGRILLPFLAQRQNNPKAVETIALSTLSIVCAATWPSLYAIAATGICSSG